MKRRLTLTRDTLAELTTPELQDVRGGAQRTLVECIPPITGPFTAGTVINC